MIITGPNMAGKSTVVRATALICSELPELESLSISSHLSRLQLWRKLVVTYRQKALLLVFTMRSSRESFRGDYTTTYRADALYSQCLDVWEPLTNLAKDSPRKYDLSCMVRRYADPFLLLIQFYGGVDRNLPDITGSDEQVFSNSR